MAFVFALVVVIAVLIAGDWEGDNVLMALLAGLGLGAWLTRLIDARIRRIAGEPAKAARRTDGVDAALQDIHWRLKRLEEARGLGPSPMEAGAAKPEAVVPATPVAEPDAAPEPDPWLAGSSAQAAHSGNTSAPARSTSAKHAASPRPAAPPSPSALERLIARGRDWLLGGNTVVRVGIIVLFFGVAFLLRFAAERVVLSPDLRVTGVGLGALALLAIGWRLRTRREAYALALQGAGVGLLYLTLFGAFRLYQLLPPAVALLAMVAVSGFSALLALLQNSRALMTIGVTGGFLAPVLASTGSGNHVALFSYYAVLNLGIFAVAWFRAWRPLNLLGFVFTFAIGLAWAIKGYRPEHFASTEAFLVLFFLMFLTISVLFAQRQSESLGGWISELAEGRLPKRIVDSTLVFGLPLVAFGFQAGLVQDREFALAYSALALAALYLGLARWLQQRGDSELQLLTDSFLALGVIFATLAVPLALDARWTSASWSLEGAALVWVGIRQQRVLSRWFGLLLQLAAAMAWFIQPGSWDAATVPLLNAFCLGAVLIALAALFSAWQLQTRRQPPLTGGRALGAYLVLAWGLCWWLGAGLGEVGRLVDAAAFHAFMPSFFAVTALLLTVLARRLAWPQAEWPVAGLAPALIWVFLLTLGQGHHALGNGGWLAWPAALLIHALLLREQDDIARFPAWSPWAHALSFWLLAALGSHELFWQAQDQALAGGWQAAALVVVPGTLLWLLCREDRRAHWPVKKSAPSYLGWGAYPVLAGLAFWSLLSSFTHNGDPAPLPYLPLLNPLDLANLFVGLLALRWAARVQQAPLDTGVTPDRRAWTIALGTLTFIWLNAVLLRSLHHWANIPYTPHALFASPLVQAALSLFWTVLALLLMATGTRRARRLLWMVGAGLMAAVVIKLFFVDLDRVGSVARIVSFLGVGVLMLIIGYLAPVPPRSTESASGQQES
jgi:uncharacterized membrane protein